MKPDPLYICPYELHSKAALNKRSSRRIFPGLLLRRGPGFACLHPWPELGDLDLSDQIAALKSGARTPLIHQAFACLSIDGAARAKSVSLFRDLAPPVSHATLTDASNDWQSLRDSGFTCFKIKGSPASMTSLGTRLNEGSRRQWRFDFNGTLTAADTREWLTSLTSHQRDRLDFIEDPCPYNAQDWAGLAASSGCALAADRHLPSPETKADFLVIKPALTDPGVLHSLQNHPARWVFTSYMDHPLGQLYAGYLAARTFLTHPEKESLCGLTTHPLFEKTSFSEKLGSGPTLETPEGTGLGFDDLLEKLPWKALTTF
ncbi:MAG: enolase C-terminal domain-like protein [Verrucomicrobiota bacterium]